VARSRCTRNRSRPADRLARPRYAPTDELRAEALALLAARMAYAASRGDVPAWWVHRAWVQVVLFWAVDR
jgi:hypothetical protein